MSQQQPQPRHDGPLPLSTPKPRHDGPLPLSTLCDATGINQSLVQNLYEEVVNDEPETRPHPWIERIKHIPSCRCTDSFSDTEDDDAQPPQLVAVAEAELEAAFATADQDQQQKNQPDASSGEELPLLGQQPQTEVVAVADPVAVPRRRRHVRDVSEDFAAQALQAIHAPDGEVGAAEREKMQRPQAPLIPPSVLVPERRPAAGATQKPHRRSQSAFTYGSGQKLSAAEYRANILGNLMQHNGTLTDPKKTRDGGSLRDLIAPSESFRMVHRPTDGAPQPARIRNHHRAGTWDFASAPSTGITDPGTMHHCAAFVLLDATDTTSPEPQAKETGTRGHRHRRGHTTIGIESGSAATAHTDTSGHHHRRGHSLLPDAIMAPLERGLERGMSILPSIPIPQIEIPTSLPSDIDEVKLTIDVTEGPKGEPENVDVLLVVKRSVPFIGYALLVGACLCLSTTGAVLDKQKGVSPTLKAYWRMCATFLFLFPFALRAVLGSGGGIPKLTKNEWSLFVWCGLGYAACAEFFVLALSMTTVMNVYIFANMHCLLFVVLKVITGAPLSIKEGLGAVIGFLGGIVCAVGGKSEANDSSPSEQYIDRMLGMAEASETTSTGVPSYVGCLVAVVSACGTVLYLSCAKRLRPRCDVRVYLFLQFFIASWWLFAMMLIKGEYFALSSDPHIGLWGWATPQLDRLGIEMWLVLISNMGGIAGYIVSMRYFEPLVISCCQNINPILSSIFSVLFGVNSFPSSLALFGDAIVFGGTYMVISSESKKTEITDVKEVARERGYTIDGIMEEK